MTNSKIQEPEKALFIQRFLAFIIDIMLISSITSFIAFPFMDRDSIIKLQDSANEVVEKYMDKKISAKTYVTETTNITYQMARKNGIVTLINITLAILYFVVFQFYKNGQTIGKKLLRIRIVRDDEQGLTMNHMIFRSLIINSILIDMVLLGFITFSSEKIYFYGAGIFEFIQFILLATCGFMVMLGSKGRGLHDMIAHTRVIRTDIVKELEVCEN